eukprot:GFYU01033548.1.p1 GENE.GFYU01033548.1~~GFYU01033548.1.p1  ORF type:complete len:388 (+),score=74.41 GFYU01033548.1:166-1329(+)
METALHSSNFLRRTLDTSVPAALESVESADSRMLSMYVPAMNLLSELERNATTAHLVSSLSVPPSIMTGFWNADYDIVYKGMWFYHDVMNKTMGTKTTNPDVDTMLTRWSSLVATFDSDLKTLRDSQPFVSKFLTATVVISSIITLYILFLPLRSYNHIITQISRGDGPSLRSWRPAAYKTFKIFRFAGGLYGTTLLCFWMVVLIVLCFFFCVGFEPARGALGEFIPPGVLIIGVSFQATIFCIERFVVDKWMTDGFKSVTKPIHFSYLGLILLILNFMNGVFVACIRTLGFVIYSIFASFRIDQTIVADDNVYLDTIYCSWMSLITFRHYHHNPILRTACHVFASRGDGRSERSNRAVNKWHLLVTLHNNPSLLLERRTKKRFNPR